MPGPAPLQSTSGVNSGANTTLTLNGVTAGSCLIVEYLGQSSGSNPPTLADSNGTVFQAVTSGHHGTATAVTAVIGYVANAAAGTHVFTLTSASTARPSFGALQEWSLLTTTPLDQDGFGGGTTAQSASATSGATTQPVELVIACLGIVTSSGISNEGITDPPAGFTSLVAQQNTTGAEIMGAEICYLIQSSTGAQSASWSWTDSNTIASACAIATFLSTAAAPSSGGSVGYYSPGVSSPC